MTSWQYAALFDIPQVHPSTIFLEGSMSTSIPAMEDVTPSNPTVPGDSLTCPSAASGMNKSQPFLTVSTNTCGLLRTIRTTPDTRPPVRSLTGDLFTIFDISYRSLTKFMVIEYSQYLLLILAHFSVSTEHRSALPSHRT